MSKLLLKNVDYLVTFNDKDEILRNYDILVEGNKITKIGKDIQTDEIGDTEIIDATGKVVLPGFVNTHHHLYQTMFRGIDEVQEMPFFHGWKDCMNFGNI